MLEGVALDVTVVADRNHHGFFRDQLVQIHLADFLTADVGATLVAVLPLQFLAIAADHGENVFFVGENSLMFGDFFKQLTVFAAKFFLLEVHQLAGASFSKWRQPDSG